MITQCNRGELFPLAISFMKPTLQLLDVGPGIRPFPYIQTQTHICCEPYYEYSNILKTRNPNLVVLNMSWSDAVKYFPEKSVDTIVLSDVIEHLEKDIALDLLSKTISIAKKQILIFTPLGFFEQTHPDGIDAWGLHGGEWQTHRSGWLPEDFPEVSGGSWNFYVCPDFHLVNNQNVALPSPKGAFWAIWNAN